MIRCKSCQLASCTCGEEDLEDYQTGGEAKAENIILRQQLAECKATNGMLREAVSALLSRFSNKQYDQNTQPRTFGCNHTAETCFACEGLVSGWKAINLGKQALALPNDETALNELIAERTVSLTAEVERLKSGRITWEEHENLNESDVRAVVKHYEQQNAELTAQRDAAMKDAERWRLASTSRNFGIANWCEYGQRTSYDAYACQLIDAAIANCKEPGK